MGIGGALAEARSEAGLTITQVSQRTRIRETIIREIERDDYTACGGDFYARGHIRAIARVVGADPVPLIEEYDAARMPPPLPADAAPGRAPRQPDPDADTNPDVLNGGSLEFGLPDAQWPSARRRAASWLAAARSWNASAAARPGPAPSPDKAADPGAAAVAGVRTGIGITAAEAFRPRLPLEFERRRPRLGRVLGLLALAVIGVLIYLLVARGPAASRPPAAPRSHHSAAAAAHHASGAATGSPIQAATLRPVAVASAAAFGPGGSSQGDDPRGAALAVDGSPATAWHSDWYTTAQLGGLQSGTGLLLSLGTTDTIAGAAIAVGPAPGGTVELRAGNTPALADMPVLAMAANPGRALTMRLSVPVRARYVLIWFTSLPPDSAGTYEASVYAVRLSGPAS